MCSVARHHRAAPPEINSPLRALRGASGETERRQSEGWPAHGVDHADRPVIGKASRPRMEKFWRRTACPASSIDSNAATTPPIAWPSSRARGAPRQKCGPAAKERCRFSVRPTSRVWGRSNTAGSRFAAPITGDRNSPARTRLPRIAVQAECLPPRVKIGCVIQASNRSRPGGRARSLEFVVQIRDRGRYLARSSEIGNRLGPRARGGAGRSAWTNSWRRVQCPADSGACARRIFRRPPVSPRQPLSLTLREELEIPWRSRQPSTKRCTGPAKSFTPRLAQASIRYQRANSDLW